MGKYTLYFLLSCSICQGCGSSTQVRRKTEAGSISDSLMQSSGTHTHRKNEIRTELNRQNRQERQERIVLLFDTDKPVSPQSGLPPVKEISFAGTVLREESQNNQAAYREESRQADSSLTVRTHREEENKKEIQTRKKTKPPVLLQRIVLTACLLAFVCLWFVLLRTHLFSKIKALCRSIFKG